MDVKKQILFTRGLEKIKMQKNLGLGFKRKNKCKRREGTYLSFPTFMFGMKHFSCLFLSMFLQR
jgi:hypothetical protein